MPYHSEILVVGCGNVLFKDDGYGPIIINILQKYFNDKNDYVDPFIVSYIEEEFDKNILNQLKETFADKQMPDNVQFVDGATAAPTNLFSLPDSYWKKLIIVDVVEFDAEPGTVRVFSPDDMQKGKYDNAHGLPVEEPLQQIAETCDVVIVGCKPKEVPTPDVDMGLTDVVEKAIPESIDIILKEIGV